VTGHGLYYRGLVPGNLLHYHDQGGPGVPSIFSIRYVPDAAFLGIKRLRREADHSPVSSIKADSAWKYTSTSSYLFAA
jgi:hypothetical protein